MPSTLEISPVTPSEMIAIQALLELSTEVRVYNASELINMKIYPSLEKYRF